MIAIADSILLDHHLAEDVAQEALATACRGLKTLKRQEAFGSWVGSICRNVARDYLVNERDDVEDEQKEILAEAVAQLPQHLREVIFLRFYNKMSYEQMSKVLGATQQSIDGRLRRAKKKIAAYLAKKGFRR